MTLAFALVNCVISTQKVFFPLIFFPTVLLSRGVMEEFGGQLVSKVNSTQSFLGPNMGLKITAVLY